MINTDGAATVANYPLKNGGRDLQTVPPSPEVAAAARVLREDAEAGPRPENEAPVFWECYTVFGLLGDGRFVGTFEARSVEEAEEMAERAQDDDLNIAGVIKGESDVVA